MYRGVFFRIRGYFFHGLHDLSQRACVRDDTTLSIKFEIEFWRSTARFSELKVFVVTEDITDA